MRSICAPGWLRSRVGQRRRRGASAGFAGRTRC